MPSNRGVVYLGLGKAQVQDIDFPTFYNPAGKAIDHGVILKAIATNICGSDQHMMRGRVDDALSGRRHVLADAPTQLDAVPTSTANPLKNSGDGTLSESALEVRGADSGEHPLGSVYSTARRRSAWRLAHVRHRLTKGHLKPIGIFAGGDIDVRRPVGNNRKIGKARSLAADQRRARRSRLGMGGEIADRRGSRAPSGRTAHATVRYGVNQRPDSTTPRKGGRTMRFENVNIDGLDIFYREAGDETSPKLVLLHGFPASSHQYRAHRSPAYKACSGPS